MSQTKSPDRKERLRKRASNASKISESQISQSESTLGEEYDKFDNAQAPAKKGYSPGRVEQTSGSRNIVIEENPTSSARRQRASVAPTLGGGSGYQAMVAKTSNVRMSVTG